MYTWTLIPMFFFPNVTATEDNIILSESWLIYFIFLDRHSKTFFFLLSSWSLELEWHLSEAVQALVAKESPK